MRSRESCGPESVVRDNRRTTRRKFSSEEKIRIVLEGFKGKESVSTICLRGSDISTVFCSMNSVDWLTYSAFKPRLCASLVILAGQRQSSWRVASTV
jgi:hypothetical protein